MLRPLRRPASHTTPPKTVERRDHCVTRRWQLGGPRGAVSRPPRLQVFDHQVSGTTPEISAPTGDGQGGLRVPGRSRRATARTPHRVRAPPPREPALPGRWNRTAGDRASAVCRGSGRPGEISGHGFQGREPRRASPARSGEQAPIGRGPETPRAPTRSPAAAPRWERPALAAGHGSPCRASALPGSGTPAAAPAPTSRTRAGAGVPRRGRPDGSSALADVIPGRRSRPGTGAGRAGGGPGRGPGRVRAVPRTRWRASPASLPCAGW